MAHVCRELLGGSENENVEQTICYGRQFLLFVYTYLAVITTTSSIIIT
jgi:hypothetical protein